MHTNHVQIDEDFCHGVQYIEGTLIEEKHVLERTPIDFGSEIHAGWSQAFISPKK